jgi:heme exporter protein CcmD
MKDYGFFLWGSYAATAVVIAIELVTLYLRRRKARELANSVANNLDSPSP